MQFRELTERYQLQKILRSTRFGTVLRATEISSGRSVVVKLITIGPFPGLAAGAPDFEKLATALAETAHPNLPAVLDFGFTNDGSAFLVLEPLEGKGLEALTGSPPARVVSLAAQALNGLEALASRGLAHHNVSPDNLFVVAGPEGEQVKLLGLGTAIFRPRGPAAAQGSGAENARFHAPELAAGGAADWRADLYSLALTTCQCLGATVGFGEPPIVQLPLAVSFDLENDEALRQGLERSLRQRPGERPQLRDLRAAFWMAAGGAAAPVVPVPAPRPPAQTVANVPPFQPAAPAQAPVPRMVPNPRIPPAAPQPSAALTALPAVSPAQSTAAPDLQLPATSPAAVEEPGDVLSAVDEEVLNALLAVPPPPPRPVEPTAPEEKGKIVPFLHPASPSPAPHPGAAPARTPWLRRPAVLAAIAGGLAAGALILFWLLRPRPQPVVVAAPQPAIVLPKPPSEPPTARLEEAKNHLGLGEDLEVRRVLRGISFGEQGLLSPAGCRELTAVEETLALTALERLPADLANGLKAGDLGVLQGVVEAGAGQEAGLPPEVRANFDRARNAVAAYAQVRAAASQGEPGQVLARFSEYAKLLPKASDPEDLRGKAASVLETRAEALARDAHYAEALAGLAPLQQSWPERTSLKERMARYETSQRTEAEQAALLASLPNIERRKRPSEALQLLAGVEPTPHLAPRFAEVRARLEDQLARLDKETPKLVLRDGYLLEYARGTVAELSFRVTDDYEVRQVKLMARPQGGKFRELSPEKNRAGYYTVELSPAFHKNGNVDLYVTANDLSGHQATLGTPDKPMQLKRKQGFSF
jgi:serine/threonine protein kinase